MTPRTPTRLALEALPGRDTPTVLPAGFTESLVATGFDPPTALEVAPDGRLLLAQQNGKLFVIENGAKVATPALDLSARLSTVGERGLLGVTLDPNFTANGYVYVYYTRADPLNNRVSRFTMAGNAIDPATELVLADLDPLSAASNHNGGALHFAADGTLLVATGENANPPSAQSLATRHGKILRYNRDGTIPADNPTHFDGVAGTPSGVNRAIYAVGFRNPFTFAVQPGTGAVFVNDVGQSTTEEVDRLAPGKNYGWPATEGDFDPAANPNFTRPLHTYAHGPDPKTQGFAITGGTFYNPATATFPAEYAGDYFFTDFVNRWVNRYDGATGTVTNFASDLTAGGVIDLDVTAGGDLLYTARGNGGPGAGTVYRIRATTAPGVATDPADQLTAPGVPVTFTVTASGTPTLRYQWQRNGTDIPGATAASTTLASPQLADSGATFRVTITNDAGSVTSRPATLTVSTDRAPVPTITGPADGTPFTAGQTFHYTGSATDAEDGVLPASRLSWRVDYLTGGAPARPLVPETPGVTAIEFAIPTVTPYTLPDVSYRVTLTATDSAGHKVTATRGLLPRTVRVTLASRPAGVTLSVGGQPAVAPTTFIGVAGVERQLAAPPTATVNGLILTFAGWSDGVAAATRTVSTPAADTIFQANYTAPPLLSVGSGTGRAAAVRLVDLAQNKVVREIDLAAGPPPFAREARVATADFTGDGVPDIVVGAGPGGAPTVTVYDGLTGGVVATLSVFEESFAGGVFVAAADFDGDGVADLVVTPDEGGGPRVRVFHSADVTRVVADFFAIADPSFRGGARPAVGDLTGDGVPDLVVAAGSGGGPRVAGYDGTSLRAATPVKLFGDFFAFEPTARDGVYLALSDLNADGRADLVVGGGPGGGPRVRAMSGADLTRNVPTTLADFFAGDPSARGGVRVAADGRGGFVTGGGPGSPARVSSYRGADPTPTALPAFEDAYTGGVYVG